MRTRVKICGITCVEDALLAVDAGADALGMVFYAPSPRDIAVNMAAEIAATIPAFVTLVGLFVNADQAEINGVLKRVPLDLIQYHGDESPDFCEAVGKPYIKALRVGSAAGGLKGGDLSNKINLYKGARSILLDTYRKGVPGGTGEQFDWDLLPQAESIGRKAIILAGGLTPGNVNLAITRVRPFAVDVSGGVESAPSVKDAGRIRAFLKAVRLADQA